MAKADPRDAQKQTDLLKSLPKLGLVEIATGKYDVAKTHFVAGRGIADALLAKKLSVVEVKKLRAALDWDIARCQQLSLATRDWNELLQTSPNQSPELLMLRASKAPQNGRLAEAIQAADELQKFAQQAKPKSEPANVNGTAPRKNVVLYLAASAYSVIGAAHSAAAQQAERKKYIDLALSTLKAAIAAGFDEFDQMKEDDDFEILRDLPEFRALFPKPTADDSKEEVQFSDQCNKTFDRIQRLQAMFSSNYALRLTPCSKEKCLVSSLVALGEDSVVMACNSTSWSRAPLCRSTATGR